MHAAILGLALFLAADAEPTPTKPADVRGLSVFPDVFPLVGLDSSRQLLITGTLDGGKRADLSSDVRYAVDQTGVVKVLPGGRILPLANGTAKITATFGNHSIVTTVTVSGCETEQPINFANQIVPIFTKLGCNTGGCHGKISGQNGFRLSLIGFEPDLDYQTLVKEGRGRRIYGAAPDASLLLLKASGGIAHGGGKKMDVSSDEYKLLRRWIAAGAPWGKPDDPYVTHITVHPEHGVTTRQNKQQFAVLAHYNNGWVEDVTRQVQYDSNDPEIATVEGTGLVRTQALSGEAAIMARYQGKVTVARITVPLNVPIPAYEFPYQTAVDRPAHQRWQDLGIVPSGLCTDEEFVRRAYLDLTGTLPAPAKVLAFLADKDTNKRAKLIDELLETPEYSYYFANKWADILRVKRGGNNQNQNRAYGTFVFHDWIRESIAMDRPYDQFTRQIIGAVGDETKCPPVVWYKDIVTADQFVDNVAQVFLGTRMQCAQCHHHPFERWTQDDYWNLAAFYGRVARKNMVVPGLVGGNQQQRQKVVLYTKATGNVINKKSGKNAELKPLDGAVAEVDADDDPRQKLVDWMVAKENPFFARAVANRYWAHFFGRGIVDALDDMRVTNPPSNPALLDALAKELVEHGYSLKHLIRTICNSRTYQLSSMPNEFNKHDKQNYARYYPRRMTAEVVYDAVSVVTASGGRFPGLPEDTHAPKRAIMLPDESFQSYFLDVFGRPQRLSACECERVNEANLAQVLHMLNSDEVQQKLARVGGRADQLAKDQRPDAEKVEEAFLWAVGRKPSPAKLALALKYLDATKDKKSVYEDILWALLQTKEFQFNR
jgi:hypothetical protein